LGSERCRETMAAQVVSPKGQVMDGGYSFSRSAASLRRRGLKIAPAPAAAIINPATADFVDMTRPPADRTRGNLPDPARRKEAQLLIEVPDGPGREDAYPNHYR